MPSSHSHSKPSLKRAISEDNSKRGKKKKSADKDDLSAVIRRDKAATYYAQNVANEVKTKMEILQRCTLRPIVIYYEPEDAAIPDIKWRLYPFKNNQPLPIMYLHRQSYYIIGRNTDVCAVHVSHCSCSNQHAVLQYRTFKGSIRPFIMDLKSMNGTQVNQESIPPLTYVQLFEQDVIKFGFSTRQYVLLHQNSEGLKKHQKSRYNM